MILLFCSSSRNFHCYCEDGYTGINCETDWNECWNNPCMNDGECIDLVARFNCSCPTGFRGEISFGYYQVRVKVNFFKLFYKDLQFVMVIDDVRTSLCLTSFVLLTLYFKH